MKFLRMIQVWCDITMPRYWWQEFDTYSYNTKNSCSTMHKLFNKDKLINKDIFEYDPKDEEEIEHIISVLNKLRGEYFSTIVQTEKDKILKRTKTLLPEGYLQLRTVNTNYAELRNIYFQRRNHRLKLEWQDTFCEFIKTSPYANELICFEKGDNNA
jgi:hypothetical protein